MPTMPSCQACFPGFYKNNPEKTACTACAVGQISPNTSMSQEACVDCAPQYCSVSTSGSMCAACPTNAEAPVGGVVLAACACAPGYTGPSNACKPCASGTYKDTVGCHNCTRYEPGFAGVNASGLVLTSTPCMACAADTYEYLETCTTCPSAAVSNTGSDSVHLCACVAGYTPSVGGIASGGYVLCAAGLFKPASGNIVYTLCANNTFSADLAATNASMCQACPANTAQMGSVRDDVSTCVC